MAPSSIRRTAALFSTWYSQQIDRRPSFTKSISAGIIGATGDLLCQYLSIQHVEKMKQNETVTMPRYDWQRTGRFLVMGSFWVAPVTNYWYSALATRLVPGKTSVSRVIKRLIIDQFVFAPLFCPSFMGLLWLLEGLSMTSVAQKLKEVAPAIVVANWVLWIPAMSVNFSVIPLKFQVLFGNVVALVWNVYLSFMSTRGSAGKVTD